MKLKDYIVRNRKEALRLMILICIMLIIVLVNIIKDMSPTVVNELGSYEVEITEYSVDMENFDEVLELLPIKSITVREKVQEFTIEFLKKLANANLETEDEILKYYESNQTEIDKYLYKSSNDTFEELINKIENTIADEMQLTGCVFSVDSYKENENYMSFEISVIYNDTDEFKFRVYLPVQDEEIEKEQIKFELL